MNQEKLSPKEDILSNMINSISEGRDMIEAVLVNPSEMIFEERVKMNCFYCGKYKRSWKCPPNIPTIDYPKMFGEYQSGALVYIKLGINANNYDDIRNESSVKLHRALLECEKYLWNHNNPIAISFIGGSCKLCKNGCGKEDCNNPYMARTPLEATGVNVVKSAEKYGINIVFPPKEEMMRVGLLLW